MSKGKHLFAASLFTAVMALGLFLAFYAVPAMAQQDYPRNLSLTWTQPTTYMDGTPLQAGDLRGTLVTCWRQNEPNNFIIDEEYPAPNAGGNYANTFVGVVPNPGTYVCGLFAVTFDNLYSDMSNTVERKYTGKPMPPSSVTIVVD